jgi:hypothetical protein
MLHRNMQNRDVVAAGKIFSFKFVGGSGASGGENEAGHHGGTPV